MWTCILDLVVVDGSRIRTTQRGQCDLTDNFATATFTKK
jgi:hypothetical protein